MKIFEFLNNYKSNDVKCVICEADGIEKCCNSLSVHGTCISKNYICSCAIAAIVEKDKFTQYLAIKH